MIINYKVYETSEVERISSAQTILQGENNYITLRFSLPETIRGYTIANYTNNAIKYESERGEIVKEFAQGENTGVLEFDLKKEVTRFKSARVQLLLENNIDEAEPIKWRSIPFTIDFVNSINARVAKGDLEQ